VSEAAPLICHIVFRFDVGGLENGVVNLINRLPVHEFRHAVIALTTVTDFRDRITRDGVTTFAMEKPAGKGIRYYWRLYRCLRRLSPAIVHTRNLPTLVCQLIAWLAGVRCRIHSEHGWDVFDPTGRRRRYVWLRRLLDPLVHRYVALSREIEAWLENDIAVTRERIVRICNGVDTERFRPADSQPEAAPVVIGTVTRLSGIKDPLNVVDAFARLRADKSAAAQCTWLVIVGDGEMMDAVRTRVTDAGLTKHVHLAGVQHDVVPWLQRMHVFVLGSRREGISNTILEAMACGLPVVATRTGGNTELVEDGVTGTLVPVGDPAALAEAIGRYVMDPNARRATAAAARRRALGFSLDAMVEQYADVYRRELAEHG
jgi:sugar transferase (PEP-CTERM/EpsH1 system associated)